MYKDIVFERRCNNTSQDEKEKGRICITLLRLARYTSMPRPVSAKSTSKPKRGQDCLRNNNDFFNNDFFFSKLFNNGFFFTTSVGVVFTAAYVPRTVKSSIHRSHVLLKTCSCRRQEAW